MATLSSSLHGHKDLGEALFRVLPMERLAKSTKAKVILAFLLAPHVPWALVRGFFAFLGSLVNDVSPLGRNSLNFSMKASSLSW